MNLKSLLPLIPATALACFSLATASAAPIAIVNASFETPSLPDPSWPAGYTVGFSNQPTALTAVPGWIISQGNPDFIQPGGQYNPSSAGISVVVNSPDGNQSAYASNTDHSGSIGTLTQNTSASFVAGTIYQLSAFAATYGTNAGTFKISLLSNGAEVANMTLDAASVAVGTFKEINLTYVAPTNGGVIGVALTFLSGADAFQLGLFDDVTLNTVPEPSTAILFGLAGMTLFFRKRTSRRELIS